MSLDKEVFKGKTISDLFKEIYKNSKDKEKQIMDAVHDLQSFVEDPRGAEVFAPIVREYLELSVKNDEHLIKMVSVIQKFENAKNGGTDELLSEDELQAILSDVSSPVPPVDKTLGRPTDVNL